MGVYPRPYQERLAEKLRNRQHVLLRAPTGAGKTLGVIAPFLLCNEEIGARRLIYALPMRTLAQGIYAEVTARAAPFGLLTTIQTGAQPEDEFFTRGDIVVCTYDQLLSGFLCGPYGLPDKLHNINAAAVAGNLVVFDEFHLMDPDKAFATAVECIRLFGAGTLSVWMTATATSPLCAYLQRELDAQEVSLSETELFDLYEGLGIRRTIHRVSRDLSIADIEKHRNRKTLVVVNRVGRAQQLYRDAVDAGLQPELLHSQFFSPDRDYQRIRMDECFGKYSQGPALAIATQVVEAGLDLSADVLLTELCPMNALIQRAGRCARFEGETGHVYVFDAETNRPYEVAILERTNAAIVGGCSLDPATAASWVEKVHTVPDGFLISATGERRLDRIRTRVQSAKQRRDSKVSDLIRRDSDTVRLVISNDPRCRKPSAFESVSVWRNRLAIFRKSEPLQQAWVYNPDAQDYWSPVTAVAELQSAYIVSLPPQLAYYTNKEGLVLGKKGTVESYPAIPHRDPPSYQYRRELWRSHTDAVVERSLLRIDNEAKPGTLLSRMHGQDTLIDCARWAAQIHDLGKLQSGWDGWAQRYQKLKDPRYVHAGALAHTDYNPQNSVDREASRAASAGGIRPPHAAASAIYGCRELRKAKLPKAAELSVLYAVVTHHGGSWQAGEVQPHCDEQEEKLTPSEVNKFNDLAFTFFAGLRAYWPLASYLVRTLRLADQKATEDYQSE